MTLGLFEDRNRRRRRSQISWFVVRWMFVMAVGLGVGLYAHQVGTKLARQDVRDMEERIGRIQEENAQLRTDIEGFDAALREERKLLVEWQERYADEVPSPEEAQLMAAIRKRIDAGVSAARIAEVVAMARDDTKCTPLEGTRRFIVRNPVYEGANDTASFADNAITVSASGEAAVNASGRPEAWFDPAKPVTLRLVHLGGETSEKTGLLPLHHATTIGDREYRFSALAGARSFIKVTGQVCPYP